METQATVIILLGPPGSGKGTQAARLQSALGIPAISTGEILRRECQSGSDLGRAVQSALDSGQLVSDELINQVVARRLGEDCRHGCILDGYPRTASQARYLDELLVRYSMPKPVVFDFRIPVREVVARLSRRRQCMDCGRISWSDPQQQATEMFCDRDGAPLTQRADDNPKVVRARLRIYIANAEELVRYYGARLVRVFAKRSPEKISDELLRMIGVGHSTTAAWNT